MGAKANIAAITALNTTDYPDNIVFAASGELKFLLLQKTSTATVNNTTVWAATPSGRWLLVGGSGGGGSAGMLTAANIAAVQALDISTLANGTNVYAIAEAMTLVLDKVNFIDQNNVTSWYTTPSGNASWYAHPSSVIVSSTYPPSNGAALPGTTWIWAETGHEADSSLSVVTYVWRGVAGDVTADQWTEISARPRIGSGVPNNIDNQIHGQEFWVDSSNHVLYYAFRHPEYGDSWVAINSPPAV